MVCLLLTKRSWRKYNNKSFEQISHNERGIENLWTSILDGAFDGTDLYISGGEAISNSMKVILNRDRQGDPITPGYKYDGIILSTDCQLGKDRVEYGFVEVARDSKKKLKYINDHSKILKGMLVSFMEHKNWKKGIRVSIMVSGKLRCFVSAASDISRTGTDCYVSKAPCWRRIRRPHQGCRSTTFGLLSQRGRKCACGNCLFTCKFGLFHSTRLILGIAFALAREGGCLR